MAFRPINFWQSPDQLTSPRRDDARGSRRRSPVARLPRRACPLPPSPRASRPYPRPRPLHGGSQDWQRRREGLSRGVQGGGGRASVPPLRRRAGVQPERRRPPGRAIGPARELGHAPGRHRDRRIAVRGGDARALRGGWHEARRHARPRARRRGAARRELLLRRGRVARGEGPRGPAAGVHALSPGHHGGPEPAVRPGGTRRGDTGVHSGQVGVVGRGGEFGVGEQEGAVRARAGAGGTRD